MKATLGSILVNAALPEELRDYDRVWDKKNTQTVLDIVAKKYPDRYKDIVHKLHEIGGIAAYVSGHSVSLDHVRHRSLDSQKAVELRRQIDQINDGQGTPVEKNQKLLEVLDGVTKAQEKSTLKRLADEGNPLAEEVLAGARGNATQLNSMIGSSILMLDQNDNPAPVPVVRSLSQGLSPAEYWAGSYGTRKGAISTKMATADAGFLAKQLALAAHKLIATDDEPQEGLGLPVDADDVDNVGAVLARDVGPYKAGTLITPAMVKNWPRGTKRILVRSPLSDIGRDGGIPRVSLGHREKSGFPEVGEQVGIPAIQTITEALSQGSLNVKHSGGAGGIRKAGFPVINQLLQVPKVFPSGAAHAAADGAVSAVQDAPQGGKYVFIGEHKHYVPPEQEASVKVGDVVEAGDVLSNGLPNPAVVVEHKGIGEGRRYFMDLMRKVFEDSKISTNRRNVELLARSIVNHVEVTDDTDSIPGAMPGDVVEYDRLAAVYKPREGAISLPTNSAKQGFLEKPVLHYSIGTRITPRVRETLKEFSVPEVTIHPEPPPFRTFQQRAMTQLLHTPDWMERLGSFYVGKGLLDAVHRGGSSDLDSTSYIPRIVTGQPLTRPQERSSLAR